MTLNEFQKEVSGANSLDNTFRSEMGLLAWMNAATGRVSDVTALKITDVISYEEAQKRKMRALGELLRGLALYAGHVGFDLEDIAKYNIRKHDG